MFSNQIVNQIVDTDEKYLQYCAETENGFLISPRSLERPLY